jgi:hypothetical protein
VIPCGVKHTDFFFRKDFEILHCFPRVISPKISTRSIGMQQSNTRSVIPTASVNIQPLQKYMATTAMCHDGERFVEKRSQIGVNFSECCAPRVIEYIPRHRYSTCHSCWYSISLCGNHSCGCGWEQALKVRFQSVPGCDDISIRVVEAMNKDDSKISIIRLVHDVFCDWCRVVCFTNT